MTKPNIHKINLTIFGVLVVFLFHWAPWNNLGPLVEEWGFSLLWEKSGWNGFSGLWESTSGRPGFSTLWFSTYALSDGNSKFMYLILGLVASAQFLVVIWALKPAFISFKIRYLLAVILAIHPWWYAGFTGRFLHAQVSVLIFILWIGFLVRFLRQRSSKYLYALFLGPLLSAFFYQALLLVFFAVALFAALISRVDKKDKLLLVLVTFLGVCSDFLYVFLSSISSGGYEGKILESADFNIRISTKALIINLVNNGLPLLLVLIFIGLLLVFLYLENFIQRKKVFILLIATACAPLMAATFSASLMHLNDPDRVFLPIGLYLWSILTSLLILTDRKSSRLVGISSLVLLTIFGFFTSFIAIIGWAKDARIQEMVLSRIESVSDQISVNDHLIYIDASGEVGDVYTLLPEIFSISSIVVLDKNVSAELCTLDGISRNHPTANKYPIQTTKYCSEILDHNFKTLVKYDDGSSIVLVNQLK